jgi:transaldolase
MKLFLDTADVDEIRTVAQWGVLDGVTTNPSLYARVKGATYDDVLLEICGIVPGPVSAEVVAACSGRAATSPAWPTTSSSRSP